MKQKEKLSEVVSHSIPRIFLQFHFFNFWNDLQLEEIFYPDFSVSFKVFPRGADLIKLSGLEKDEAPAVMVAQVVERWHSVRAGQVQIPGCTWPIFGFELLSIYSRWVACFF